MISESNGSAVISGYDFNFHYHAWYTITLPGVSAASITAADFGFV
jgi:hypothetical protein